MVENFKKKYIYIDIIIDLKVFIRNFNYKIIYIILETIIFLFFFFSDI